MLKQQSVDQLAAMITNGSKVAVPCDNSGVSMSLTYAMSRRELRDLHLVCMPTSGLQAELLIGAGCVSTVESSAITLGEYGAPYRFHAGLKAGRFKMLEATCPAIHTAIQAGGKGIPFMPMRGVLGSDLLPNRPDWIVVDNPFSESKDPIVLLPAIRPDFTIFHAPYADRNGNVFIGRRRELIAMAHAAIHTLVTVEEVRDVDLLATEESASGILTENYIDGLAVCPHGAAPLKMRELYDYDASHLKMYGELARSEEGFRQYIDKFAFNKS